MIKILTIVGARPQLIKAAAISRAIRTVYPDKIQEVILHTGQHYDKNMSEVFFTELSIPRPEVNLNVGSGSHGSQTANMLEGIERAILDHQPDVLVIYGDTNSTCAGALAAAKLHVPIVHIEAGLRSFNKRMPEEVNRITADHMSTLLFSPNKSGLENLIKEGFNINSTAPHSIDNPKVYQCGDIMYDNSLHFSSIADGKAGIKKELNLGNGDYILSTVHRPSNTDDPANLSQIFEAFLELVKKVGDFFKLDTSIVTPIQSATLNQTAKRPPYTGFNIDKAIKELEYHPKSFEEGLAILSGQLENK